MADDVFLSSVKKLTERNFTVAELIGATESLKAAGKTELVVQLYQLWVQFNQQDPLLYVVRFNYAAALTDSGDLAGAREALEASIAQNPDFLPSYINLGGVLERLGLAGQAVIVWTDMVNKLPSITGSAVDYKITALKQIGRVLEANHFAPNAENVLRQGLELNVNQPDVVQHFVALRLSQCKWPVVAPWERVGRKALMKGIGPLSMAIYTDDPMLQLGAAWNYNKNFIGYASYDYQENHRQAAEAPRAGRRRIGYVSSDMRNHAVGFVMAELFELHDREEFEIFVYYCGIATKDDLQDRIKASAEHWVDISKMDDDTAARRIMEDGIEILVDVNGYTKDARTRLFALRPAPVIANWLGYPGSMASPYHHYIIADDWIIPQDSEHFYTEKVLRLPCYQPNDRKRVVSAARPTRRDAGLPEEAVVFCCFNGAQKFSRFTFERWMAILKRVPDSVLWLLDGSETTNKRLAEYAAQQGVAAERLIFAEKKPNPEHLARYPLADLFLDTSPYGAHVTASDALWMGVPILTVSGRGFASRVCGSLARAAGLPELVCGTPEEYIERAVALGTDRAELQRLKKRLETGRDSCTLFDTDALARRLEGLYGQMWEEFLQGRLPHPDLTNLELYLDLGSEEDHEAMEMLAAKDYSSMYKSRLARRHRYCPIPEDQRLWTATDIAEVEKISVFAPQAHADASHAPKRPKPRAVESWDGKKKQRA